jgi:hypothetical protein
VDAGRDPEAAAWERARLVRAEREQDVLHRREERERQARQAEVAVERAERSQRRRSTAVWLLALVVGVGLLVVVMALVTDRASRSGDSGTMSVAGAERLAPSSESSAGPSDRRSSPALQGDTPPVIDMTGEDLDRVWRQAQVLEGWLLRHPQPDLVDRIYAPGTGIHTDVHAFIDELARNGRAVVVEKYRIVDVEVVERPTADEVEVRYTDTYERRDLVDTATGTVLDREVSDGQVRAWVLRLQRPPGGSWSVVALSAA